ncbi:L-histidine N(alpha)-methyltransferase [Nitrosomonas supralitoralis]|uniref:L-histidine N(Alpha)-methyltransferase n=1 Tax=Nitrosomonas supralitoralis TaxID=2116706 RepID=A0A2P7NSR1_9PROT|nr:L-histidine N(alpha)-methyltransferase [Nitrosomonas supralitoralis]PSJ16512.1 L-histidine N(alpha)-methyltransferase [Nitrosomonas supralitoralis]
MSIVPKDVITRIADLNFLADVYQGLDSVPKTLPCKYFYDEHGSWLFEKITQLKEYYLTNVELDILDQNIEDIAFQLGSNVTIIEPGCGAGHKVQKILNAIEQPKTFIPFEISAEMLSYSVSRLRILFPHLEIQPLEGDFTNKKAVKQIISETNIGNSSNVVFFPGSTIGNFSRPEAADILRNFKRLSGINGKILLGIDLIKDKETLIRAYDDTEGITAEFNKNILTRINAELDGNFDIQNGFKHKAIFNENDNRIEMHLVSCKPQVVIIAGKCFHFDLLETIHTESSHKYSIESLTSITNQAELTLEKYWCDHQNRFAICLLSA